MPDRISQLSNKHFTMFEVQATIRLAWKGKPGTNTLAYLAHSSVKNKIYCECRSLNCRLGGVVLKRASLLQSPRE